MSFESLKGRMDAVLPRLSGVGGVLKFDMGDDGSWLVDARGSPARLLEAGSDDDADCTIRTTAETLVKLLDGALDPMLAFTLGKLKISGSMGVAMKLASALG